MIIRDFMPEDRDPLIALVHGLNQDAAQYEPYLTNLDAAAAQYDEMLRNIAEEDGFLLVAESDEQLVGFVCALTGIDDISMIEDMRQYGFISDLFVHHDYRNLGIGAELIAETEARFAMRDIRRLQVSVAERNRRAVDLYTREGFRPLVKIMEKSIG